MKQQKTDLLIDGGAFEKFCTKNDRIFGCKEAFKCHVCCPLWLAREVQYLVNEKGMTIGEAHRACLRKQLTESESIGILAEAIKAQMEGKKDYPQVKSEK